VKECAEHYLARVHRITYNEDTIEVTYRIASRNNPGWSSQFPAPLNDVFTNSHAAATDSRKDKETSTVGRRGVYGKFQPVGRHMRRMLEVSHFESRAH
jgi:hypothetical protein